MDKYHCEKLSDLSDDISAAMEIDRLCFPCNTKSLESFKDFATSTDKDAFVIRCEDGTSVGYGLTKQQARDTLLVKMGVHPDYRGGGRGLGDQIVREIVRIGHSHDSHNVNLNVRGSNDRAIALYTRNGFEEISRKDGGYKCGKSDADKIKVHMRIIL